MTTLRQTGAAERAYDRLKAMAIEFEFRPGERINEVIVSKRLGVSRTPLREALNRLESEGFLTFSPKLGFFRRKLDPKEIFDLYELRGIIEAGGARLAAARVTPEQIEELREFAHHSASDDPDRTVDDLVDLDERFHERIMVLSGNDELLDRLRVINSRIRFIRWIVMEKARREKTQGEHQAIVAALAAKDGDLAASLIGSHVGRRLDEIVEAVKLGYARIFLRDDLTVSPDN